jgi:hypothetical protein
MRGWAGPSLRRRSCPRRALLALVLSLAGLAAGCSRTSATEICQKLKGSKSSEDVISRAGQADRIENLSAPLKAWRYARDDGQCIVVFNDAKVQSVDFIAAK